MKRRSLLALIFLLIFLAGEFETAYADPLEKLSEKLIADLRLPGCPLLAVLEFPYSLGGTNTASDLVSERLLTHLVQRRIPLVERRLLGTLLQERFWRESGIIDAKSVKSSDALLGVQAVVIGTLADYPDRPATEITARIVRVDTGEILSSGRATIDRVWSDNPRRLPPPAKPAPSSAASAQVETADEATQDESTDEPASPPRLTRTRFALQGLVDRTPPPARRVVYSAVAMPVLVPAEKAKTTERKGPNEN